MTLYMLSVFQDGQYYNYYSTKLKVLKETYKLAVENNQTAVLSKVIDINRSK